MFLYVYDVVLNKILLVLVHFLYMNFFVKFNHLSNMLICSAKNSMFSCLCKNKSKGISLKAKNIKLHKKRFVVVVVVALTATVLLL